MIRAKLATPPDVACRLEIDARNEELCFGAWSPLLPTMKRMDGTISISLYAADPLALLPIADAIYRANGYAIPTPHCSQCHIEFKSAESLDENGVCEACAEVPNV